MPFIGDITNLPTVRDNTALDLSQNGHMCVIQIDPATLHLLGSIIYNWEHSFDLEWDSKKAFKDWLDNKQTAQSIKLRPSKIECRSTLYTTNQIFRCMCNRMGGIKKYQKKTTCEWKIESKWISGGCPSLVHINTYHHIDIVLGKYILNHSHAIGMENLKFI
jgi:hypothetical protein